MLRLADAWTWDFWLADDGRSYHLYFLKAPRHIGHPDERHWNVSVGHAVSADLADWTVVPDAIAPAGSELSDQRRQAGTGGGIWCLPCTSPLGPFNLTQAVRITDESLYSGRLVRDRAGRWVMLAFRNSGPDGSFIGELTDPMPIRWATDGSALELDVVAAMTPQPAEKPAAPAAVSGTVRSSSTAQHGRFPDGTDNS